MKRRYFLSEDADNDFAEQFAYFSETAGWEVADRFFAATLAAFDRLCIVTRYMGWVKKHLAKGAQKVRGIIVVAKADDRLHYAVAAIPNVEIKTFNLTIG